MTTAHGCPSSARCKAQCGRHTDGTTAGRLLLGVEKERSVGTIFPERVEADGPNLAEDRPRCALCCPQTTLGGAVPRYLVERQFSVGEAQMDAIGRRSRGIAQERFPEILWEHSHVAIDDDGRVKTFCIYEAPSEDIIRRHAGRSWGA